MRIFTTLSWLPALAALVAVATISLAAGPVGSTSSPPVTKPTHLPPGVPEPGNWVHALPGWSKDVNGLRAVLEVSKVTAPTIPMQVSLWVWNVSDGSLGLVTTDPAMLRWEVRDEKGNVIPPKNVDDAKKANLRWSYYGSGSSSPGTAVNGLQETVGGFLNIGSSHWTFLPGKYALSCTLSGPSQVAGKLATVKAWEGKIEVPAQEFTVYAKADPGALKAAADKINGAKFPDIGLRYAALAALIQPGMTYRDLQSVLPPTADANGSTGIFFMNGNFFSARYFLDGGYLVEAEGFGGHDSDGNTTFILSSLPRIIPPSRVAGTQTK